MAAQVTKTMDSTYASQHSRCWSHIHSLPHWHLTKQNCQYWANECVCLSPTFVSCTTVQLLFGMCVLSTAITRRYFCFFLRWEWATCNWCAVHLHLSEWNISNSESTEFPRAWTCMVPAWWCYNPQDCASQPLSPARNILFQWHALATSVPSFLLWGYKKGKMDGCWPANSCQLLESTHFSEEIIWKVVRNFPGVPLHQWDIYIICSKI